MLVWIIGLSGAGKTTLATEVVRRVRQQGCNAVLIDGDIVREVFGNDLGYSVEDRLKNAWRLCQLGKLLDTQGIHVVCAVLSLFPETRLWNRNNISNYYEIFIDAPLASLIDRDTKGIYGSYIEGAKKEVVGMDILFQPPESPDLIIQNDNSLENLMYYASDIAQKIISSQ